VHPQAVLVEVARRERIARQVMEALVGGSVDLHSRRTLR
ncbi:MAG: hypothetical protein QOG29_566, partial [Gaiellaceae bacterium]|nr:hypothetical protein [Gaiellaceae bacterium]